MASALFFVTNQMFKLLSKIQSVVCDWNCWAGTSFLACKIKGVVTGELHIWHSLTTREMQTKVAARAPLRCEMLSRTPVRSARFHPFCFSNLALTFKRLSEIGKVKTEAVRYVLPLFFSSGFTIKKPVNYIIVATTLKQIPPLTLTTSCAAWFAWSHSSGSFCPHDHIFVSLTWDIKFQCSLNFNRLL